MKKRIASLFMAIVMIASMAVGAVADTEERLVDESDAEDNNYGAARFTDITPDYWAYHEVDEVVQAGFFAGTTPTTFQPYRSMTRAAFVLVLSRIEGLDLESQPVDAAPFADVPVTSRFAAAIQWGKENGIVGGYDAEHFRPDWSINRQQAAAFIYRWLENYYLPNHNAELKLADEPAEQFTDYDTVSTSSDFRNALNYCRLHGLINGYSNGTFRPYTKINRGQMAAIFYRIILILPTNTEPPGPGPVDDRSIIIDPVSQQNGKTTVTITRDGKAVNLDDIQPGDTVRIVRDANSGYHAGTITVTDKDGNKITVTNGRFKMPDKDKWPVTIKVEYEETDTGGGGGGGGGGATTFNLTLRINADGAGRGFATVTSSDTALQGTRVTSDDSVLYVTRQDIPRNTSYTLHVEAYSGSKITSILIAGVEQITAAADKYTYDSSERLTRTTAIVVTFESDDFVDVTPAGDPLPVGTTGGVKFYAADGTEMNPDDIKPGDVVRFKPIEVEGYTITDVSVLDADKGTVALSGPDANGFYTFVMPAADKCPVDIIVTYKKVEEPPAEEAKLTVKVVGEGTVNVFRGATKVDTLTTAGETPYTTAGTYTVSVLPDYANGYEFESATVDGTKYTFPNKELYLSETAVTIPLSAVLTADGGDKTIEVNFAEYYYTLSLGGGFQGGNIHKLEATNIKGSDQMITAMKTLSDNTTLNDQFDGNEKKIENGLKKVKDRVDGKEFELEVGRDDVLAGVNDEALTNAVKPTALATIKTQMETALSNPLVKAAFATTIGVAADDLNLDNLDLRISETDTNAIKEALKANNILGEQVKVNVKTTAKWAGGTGEPGDSLVVEATATTPAGGIPVSKAPFTVSLSPELIYVKDGGAETAIDLNSLGVVTPMSVTTALDKNLEIEGEIAPDLSPVLTKVLYPVYESYLNQYMSYLEAYLTMSATAAPNVVDMLDNMKDYTTTPANDATKFVCFVGGTETVNVTVNGYSETAPAFKELWINPPSGTSSKVIEINGNKATILTKVSEWQSIYKAAIDYANDLRIKLIDDWGGEDAAATKVVGAINDASNPKMMKLVTGKEEAIFGEDSPIVVRKEDISKEVTIKGTGDNGPTARQAYFTWDVDGVNFAVSRALPTGGDATVESLLNSMNMNRPVVVQFQFLRFKGPAPVKSAD